MTTGYADGTPSQSRLAGLETMVEDQGGPAVMMEPLGSPMVGSWVGSLIGPDGRYEVTGLIGTGGMGEVYRAFDQNLAGMTVAVKKPAADLLRVPGLKERFETEFTALTRLEHPNVCGIVDAGTHESVPFAVLKYLSGGSLQQRYLESEINLDRRTVGGLFDWLPSIAAALDFIHSRGFIHRDIKPANILFDEHGTPYLSDFGIVSVVGVHRNGLRPTASDSSGTPGYIAPESIDGEPDCRADQYALAAVAYLFLAGKSAFPGKNVEEIQKAQLRGRPKAVHRLNRRVKRKASRVLRQAMSSDPAARFESCGQFVESLHEALAIDGRPSGGVWRTAVAATVVAAAGAGLAFVDLGLPAETPGNNEAIPAPTKEAGQDPTEEEQNTALRWMHSGQIEESLDELNILAARYPQSVWVLRNRAEAFVQLERFDLAELDLTDAIARSPSPGLFVDRAIVRRCNGEYAVAMADFSTAISESGHTDDEIRANWFNCRSECHLLLRNYPAAVEDAKTATELAPADELYQRNLRYARQQLSMHNE